MPGRGQAIRARLGIFDRPGVETWSRLALRAAGFTLVLAAVVATPHATAAEVVRTPSIFDPASGAAETIREYSWLVLGICALIFVIVAGLLAYTVARFRQRPEDGDHEPPQIYGSTAIETAWTVLPILTVFVLFMVTARTVAEIQLTGPPPDALEVRVVGHQWWWEFRYPELGVVTANELHLPVSGPDRPQHTFLRLESQDVIHSFWIPQLAGKTDVIPNRDNFMWMDPREPGLYVGQCAEYCGTQHANMLLRVYVHERDEFERWAEQQRQPARDDPRARAGRDLFQRTACINCHTVRGTVADGRFGPDLTHLMSRATLGAGVATNDRKNLTLWLEDPDHLKPGVNMPAMKLSRAEIEQVVDYLVTLQ